jgi:hypothetical protein
MTRIQLKRGGVVKWRGGSTCRRGHIRSPQNTVVRLDGRVRCLECDRIYDARRKHTPARRAWNESYEARSIRLGMYLSRITFATVEQADQARLTIAVMIAELNAKQAAERAALREELAERRRSS